MVNKKRPRPVVQRDGHVSVGDLLQVHRGSHTVMAEVVDVLGRAKSVPVFQGTRVWGIDMEGEAVFAERRGNRWVDAL